MNVLVPFLVFSIKNCKKWALVNVLKALSSTLYENGSFCLEVGCPAFLTISNVYLLHCLPTETNKEYSIMLILYLKVQCTKPCSEMVFLFKDRSLFKSIVNLCVIRGEIRILQFFLQVTVVYKSQQPAKFAGFSARFRRLLSLLHESKYVEEMDPQPSTFHKTPAT